MGKAYYVYYGGVRNLGGGGGELELERKLEPKLFLVLWVDYAFLLSLIWVDKERTLSKEPSQVL